MRSRIKIKKLRKENWKNENRTYQNTYFRSVRKTLKGVDEINKEKEKVGFLSGLLTKDDKKVDVLKIFCKSFRFYELSDKNSRVIKMFF